MSINLNDLDYKETLIKFLKIHYTPQDEMFSFINVGSRYNGRKILINKNKKIINKQRGIYQCHYIKTSNINDMNDSLINFIDSLSKYRDYYISCNTFKKARKRELKYIFTLHNIVIDIDCHKKINRDLLNYEIESFLYELKDQYESHKIPTPNSIVCTGRGIQVWWAINPIPYKAKHYYDVVKSNIMYKLKDILNDQSCHLKVDNAASNNYVGYYRLPGTFNTKAGDFSSLKIINEETMDVFEYIKSTDLKYDVVPNVEIPRGNKNLDTYREYILNKLVSIRNYEVNGYRDILTLILCNAYLSSGRTEDEAIEAILRLNDKFTEPLPQKQLISYMSSSFKRKYMFSNEKIIELLNISKDEQHVLSFYAAKYSKKMREQKRKDKKERNQKIIVLYVKGGTQIDISLSVGCSQPTVCRVIKKYERSLKKRIVEEYNEERKNKIPSRLEKQYVNTICKCKCILKQLRDLVKNFDIDIDFSLEKS